MSPEGPRWPSGLTFEKKEKSESRTTAPIKIARFILWSWLRVHSNQLAPIKKNTLQTNSISSAFNCQKFVDDIPSFFQNFFHGSRPFWEGLSFRPLAFSGTFHYWRLRKISVRRGVGLWKFSSRPVFRKKNGQNLIGRLNYPLRLGEGKNLAKLMIFPDSYCSKFIVNLNSIFIIIIMLNYRIKA